MAAEDPYVGPRPYDTRDWPRFKGRSRECRDVSALWQSNRLLVLYGPSGAGKTSLVQAGVISQLDENTVDVLPVGRVSYRALADPTRHNPYELALLSSWSPDASPADLLGLSLTEFLSRRDRNDRYGDPLPVLAAIDQFEEIFRDFPGRERYLEEFIDHLSEAIQKISRLSLLVSIQEEYLGHLIPRETNLAGHSRARFRLLQLSCSAALEAVHKPLVGTKRSFAPGVAEKLVDDLRTTEVTNHVGQKTKLISELVEPMQLQVVCAALWQALPAWLDVITEDDLRQYGDIDRTVAAFCGQMVAEVTAEYHVPAAELRDWLERTFITELGTRGTAYQGVRETSGMPNSIARALEDRHILKSERRARSLWYELQHDGMIEPIRHMAAAETLEASTEVAPADYLRAAEGARGAGDLALAERQAEAALRACDNRDGYISIRAQAERFLGDVAFQSERLWEAEGRYRRAVEHFETIVDQAAVGQCMHMIGRVLHKRGSYADAADALQTALTRCPGDPAIKEELAKVLWSSGQVAAAIAFFDTVSASAPDAAADLIDRLRLELEEPASVQDDLNKLLLLRPDTAQRADVRAARALTLASLGRISDAMTEANAAEQEAPGSGPVLIRVSGVARAAGNPSRADDLVRRAGDARNPVLLHDQLTAVAQLMAESLTG